MMKEHGARFLNVINDARARIRECTVAEMKEKLDGGQNWHLVDVREESEWQQGRLPKAIHLCKGIIERDIEETIPDTDAEIILYCGGGYRSALAADNLRKMGYGKVISMDGGFKGWKAAGYPVVDP